MNSGLGFIGRMAWRDSRSSRRRLLLFSISISLGVAALIAIGLFRASLAQAIDHAPMNVRAFIVPYYGAISRVGVRDTAFPLRETGFEMDLMSRWTTPAERPAGEAWVRALRQTLRPYAHGTYVNQLGETSEELVRQAYGVNYARLAKLKRKYDPGNVFRSNQNVMPG